MVPTLTELKSHKKFQELDPEKKEVLLTQWVLETNREGKKKLGDKWKKLNGSQRLIEQISLDEDFNPKSILGSDGVIGTAFDRLVSKESRLKTLRALAEKTSQETKSTQEFGERTERNKRINRLAPDDKKNAPDQILREDFVPKLPEGTPSGPVAQGAITEEQAIKQEDRRKKVTDAVQEVLKDKNVFDEISDQISTTLEEEGFNEKARLDAELPFYHPVNIARMVNSSLPLMASTIAGGIVGGPPGALTTGATVIGALDFKEFKDSGMDPQEALARATLESIPSAAIEAIVPLKIIKGGNPFSIYRAVKLYLNEAFHEGAQTALKLFAKDVGREPINEIFGDPEFWQEVLLDAAAGGILGPLFDAVRAPGYIAQKVADRLQLEKKITPDKDLDPFINTEPLTEEKANELIKDAPVENAGEKKTEASGILPGQEKVTKPKVKLADIDKELKTQLGDERFNKLESKDKDRLRQILVNQEVQNAKSRKESTPIAKPVETGTGAKETGTGAKAIQEVRKIEEIERESTVIKSKPLHIDEKTVPENIEPYTPSIQQINIVPHPSLLSPKKTQRPGKKKLTFEPHALSEGGILGNSVLIFRRIVTTGKTAPVELKKIRATAEAVRRSFISEAKSIGIEVAQEINKVTKKGPERHRLLDLANAYLGNTLSDELVQSIPVPVRDAVRKGRLLIDDTSNRLLDIDLIKKSQSLVKSFTENYGSYLTRTFKVFDANANWNIDTVPLKIIEEANEYFQRTRKATKEQANAIIAEILDPVKAEQWLLGASRLRGINIASLMNKNKDLAPEILNLLGEVRNPMENIVKTVERQAQMLTDYQMQEQIAKVGLEAGVFSKTKKGKLREKLFPNAKSVHKDEDGNISSFRTVKNRKFQPLAELYTTKEMALAIKEFFETQGPDLNPDITAVLRFMKKATSIGKIMQVIANPDAYPVAFMGAIAADLMNGRLIRHPKMSLYSAQVLASNYARKKTGTFRATKTAELNRVINLSNKEFLAQWDTIKKDTALIESLTRRFAALDEQVIFQEIKDGFKESIDGIADAWPADAKGFYKKGRRLISIPVNALGRVYSYGDNAGKINSFLTEAIDYARIHPDGNMKDVFKVAGDITQATTPMISHVPRLFRNLNLFGLFPTYISFFYEMARNMYNTAGIATHEISEGISQKNNRMLKKGLARMAAFLFTTALSTFLGEKAFDLIRDLIGNSDDVDEKTRKAMRDWYVTPWDRNDPLGILYHKKGEGFGYTNISYTFPQAAITGFINAAMRGESFSDAMGKMVLQIGETWFGNAILPGALIEIGTNTNKTTRKKIYNKALPWEAISRDIPLHIFERVYKPGFITKYQRILKQARKETGGWGRYYSFEEEIFRLFTFRPAFYGYEANARHRMANFVKDFQEAKDELSSFEERNLKGKELQRKRDRQEKLINLQKKRYREFIEASLQVGIPKATLGAMQVRIWKDSKHRLPVPKELRSQVEDLLYNNNPK